MKSRLPNWTSTTSVYSIIAAMLYGWTLVAFIWKLPSWLNYLSVGEIFIILTYSSAANFIESLCALVLLILLGAILPRRLLLNDFTVRGSVLALCLIGPGMAFLSQYVRVRVSVAGDWPIWLGVTLVVLIASLFMVEKVMIARRAVSWLAEQLSIFLYILIPFSLVSTVIFLIRNLI